MRKRTQLRLYTLQHRSNYGASGARRSKCSVVIVPSVALVSDMDGKAKIALMMGILVLMNGFVMANGRRSSMCCCTLSGITGSLVTLYQVGNMAQWVWNFEAYLDRNHNEQEVLLWLLEHPPPLGIKYRVVMFFLKHFLLSSKTQSVFKKYAHLKYMNCGTHDNCVTGKEFVKFMF